MGAEGSIVIMPLSQWQERTSRDPVDLGLYRGTMLGIEAVWDYYGEPYYETRIEAAPLYENEEDAKELSELAEWFLANAETHEVWT